MPFQNEAALWDLDRVEPAYPMDGGGTPANPQVPVGPTIIGPNLDRGEFTFEEPPLPEPPDFAAETIARRKRGSAKPKTNKPRMSGINL